MSTITYVCLFLSLVGLILTIMALSLQRSLWRLDMTKIHVYLSIALFVGYILFLVGIDQTQVRYLVHKLHIVHTLSTIAIIYFFFVVVWLS